MPLVLGRPTTWQMEGRGGECGALLGAQAILAGGNA